MSDLSLRVLLMGPQRVAVGRPKKTQAAISACLLLAAINVTAAKHSSTAVAGLTSSTPEFGKLIKDREFMTLLTFLCKNSFPA